MMLCVFSIREDLSTYRLGASGFVPTYGPVKLHSAGHSIGQARALYYRHTRDYAVLRFVTLQMVGDVNGVAMLAGDVFSNDLMDRIEAGN